MVYICKVSKGFYLFVSVALPRIRQVHVIGDQHAQAVLAEEQVVPARHDTTLPRWFTTAQ